VLFIFCFLVKFGVMRAAFETLTADDFPGDLRWIAVSCGVDVARKIWTRFCGSSVQCPSRLPREQAIQYMMTNFDKPVHRLALDTGLSERTIYRYMDARPQARQDKAQTSLF